jgi:hypothetical protein
LLVVLGDEGVDMDRLHERTRPALARIDAILTATGTGHQPAPAVGAV